MHLSGSADKLKNRTSVVSKNLLWFSNTTLCMAFVTLNPTSSYFSPPPLKEKGRERFRKVLSSRLEWFSRPPAGQRSIGRWCVKRRWSSSYLQVCNFNSVWLDCSDWLWIVTELSGLLLYEWLHDCRHVGVDLQQVVGCIDSATGCFSSLGMCIFPFLFNFLFVCFFYYMIVFFKSRRKNTAYL